MAFIQSRSQSQRYDQMLKTALMRTLLYLAFGLGSNLLSLAPKLEQMLCGQDDSAKGQAFSQHLEQHENRQDSNINAIETAQTLQRYGRFSFDLHMSCYLAIFNTSPSFSRR